MDCASVETNETRYINSSIDSSKKIELGRKVRNKLGHNNSFPVNYKYICIYKTILHSLQRYTCIYRHISSTWNASVGKKIERESE
jgi:hypothetical protein